MYTGITSLGLTSGGGAGTPTPYPIAKSVRFRRSASAYMSFTPSVDGDRKKLVRRFRIKRGEMPSGNQVIHSAGTSAVDSFYFDSSDRLNLSIGGVLRLTTTQTFSDRTAWYVDIGFSLDVANPTAAEKAKILVDGEEVSSYGFDDRAGVADAVTNWNASGVIQYIGRDNTGQYFDGYMSEPLGANGTTTVTSYSALSGTVQIPQSPSAVYGTNGFYLAFDDGTNTTTIGEDRSGNGNNWTTVFIDMNPGTTYDWLADTPSDNFSVFNPREPIGGVNGGVTYDGNLRLGTNTGNFSNSAFVSTVPLYNGEYYFEVTLNVLNNTTDSTFGVITDATGATSYLIRYNVTRNFLLNGVDDGTYSAFVQGDVIGFLADSSLGTLSIYRNGSLIKSKTGLPTGTWYARAQMIRSSTGQDMQTTWNFGQRAFVYTPSVTAKAVSTSNLSGVSMVVSGSFTGNGNANGPVVRLAGDPSTMTINGNSVTFGTDVDRVANGFKVISASASYNTVGANTYEVTVEGNIIGDDATLPNTAKANP